MSRARLRQLLKTPSARAAVGLAIVAALVIGLFVATQYQTNTREASQQQALLDQEAAYSNVLKESLAIYHSRYGAYPKDYQGLLDDIAASPDTYGVNSEGMDELQAIDARLAEFSYQTQGNEGYMFTYRSIVSGEVTSVTDK